MKKVFLFLGALVLSTAMWAEPITVRLKASSLPSEWGDVAIYYWSGETTNWPGEKLTAVDGWYSKTFKETTTSINIIWNNNNNGKQTVNIENVKASTCYEINGGSGNQYTVKTVDCPEPTPEVALSINGATFVDSTLTFSAVASNFSGKPTLAYSIKASEAESYTALVGDSYKIDSAGNYDVKVVATYEAEEAEAIKSFTAIVTPEPITVRLKASSLPAGWGDVAIYYWGGETTNWPGEKLTEVDGWYTKTFANTTTSINIIWNNNNKGNQTGNIENVKASTCYKISGGSGTTHTTEVVDCAGGPEPVDPDKYFIKNNWNNGSWVWKEMTPNNDSTVWEYTDIFGSWGVNIVKNDTNIAKPAEYPLESRIGGDTIQSNDTVRFAYNVALDSVVATLIGRPVPGPEPVAKYFAKNNWNGGDWAWLEMTASENDIYYLDSVVFGGTGVNINTKKDDADAIWFPADSIFVYDADTLLPLDTVLLIYDAETNKLRSKFIGRPIPEVKTYYLVGDYCNWKHDTTAIKAFELVNDTLTVTIDSLFGEIKITEGKSWDVNYGAYGDSPYELRAGASPYGLKQNGGQNFKFDADYKNAVFQIFMAEKESEQVLHLRFVSGEKVVVPEPEAQYFAKNPWNGGDWAWKKMTKVEDVYVLDSVVYGGVGVNVNTKEDDRDALWFDEAKMKHAADSIKANDTVKFVFNPADSSLIATLIGRPCKDEFGILVNGKYTAAVINPARTEVKEYMVLSVALAVNDSVQMYDNCAKAAWVIEDYMDGSYEFPVVNNKYVVEETATYDFYFQLGPDKIYIYQQQTTALDNNAEFQIPNSKFIENGNLYIRRGEHVFDAQGKLVK